MKLLTFILLMVGKNLFAQISVPEATVKTSLTISMGGQTVQETQMTTYLKDKKLRITVVSNTAKNEIFLDRTTNKMVSLYEILGKKLGFYLYDTNFVAKERVSKAVTIVKSDSTKSINGFNCNLLTLHYDSTLKMKDVTVWYNPELKFTDPTMGLNIPGIDKVNGVPVLVISEAPNGMKTTYTLLSIDRKTKLSSKLFVIPKGYSITTQEEFQKAVQKMSKG